MSPRGGQIPDYFARSTIVVPGYRNLYGRRVDLADLTSNIRQFSIPEWLSFLSRLQTMIAPPHQFDEEAFKCIYGGVVGPRTRKALQDFIHRGDGKMQLGLFTERQTSTLQQLVLLHAPESGETKLEEPEHFDALCDALFMTWDLMCPSEEARTHEEVFASLLQDMARTEGESSERLAARAFHHYQFHRETPDVDAVRIRELFEKATGVSLLDYILGGTIALTHERSRSPSEIAQAWQALPDPALSANPQEGKRLEAFYGIKCGTIPAIREEINKWDGHRDVAEYCLIGVARYPIILLEGLGRFVLNLSDLATGLFEGVRYEIIRHASAHGTKELNPQALGKEFGGLWQTYVVDILLEAFDDRLIRVREVKKEKRADYLIVYPDKMIVLEIKSGAFPMTTHFGRLSIADRLSEWKKIGIPTAATQIANTIRALRAGEIEVDGTWERDWTSTPIVPVIFTAAPVPLAWGMWPHIEQLTTPLAGLDAAGPVDKVRFLSPVDIEDIPDLTQTDEIGSLLRQWANHPTLFERPLTSFLAENGIRFHRKHLKRRFAQVFRVLAGELKLDVSKLGF